MDVTTGGIGVSCDTEGKLKIWTTNNGEIRVGDTKKLLSSPSVHEFHVIDKARSNLTGNQMDLSADSPIHFLSPTRTSGN